MGLEETLERRRHSLRHYRSSSPPDTLGVELGQTHSPFSVMKINECELDSTALARDDSVHLSRRIIHVDVLGYKYVVGLQLKAIPAYDRD